MDNVPNLAVQILIVREIPDMFCVDAVRLMDAGLIVQIIGDLDIAYALLNLWN